MIINIQVADKRAKVTGAPVIVCGNADYSVQFTFDEEWSGHVSKTARFVYVQDGSVRFTDVLFEGDTAAVPVLANTKEVRVGVLAGILKTTSSAVIPCEPSIRCGCGEPKDPTPSQYDQILDLLNGGGSNALKGKGEGAVLSFPDVSPVEHTLKVGVRSKNLFDVSKELIGKWIKPGNGEIGDYSSFNASDYIAVPPSTTFTINYVRQGAFYDENKVYIGDMPGGTVTTKRTYTMPSNAHYVRFSYQNANVSGDIVQLELGTEVGDYTPFAEISSVTLQVGGKNLCNPYDFVLGQDWNNSQNPSLAVLNMPCLPNTSYAISWSEEAKGKVMFIIEKESTTATTSNNSISVSSINKRALTTKANTNCICVLVQDTNYQNLITYDFVKGLKLQIERDTTATEYEPYKAPVTYTPKPDGTVEGVKSLYPTTALTTDAEGVIIEAEYNRDVNKAYQALVGAIVALGGSV